MDKRAVPAVEGRAPGGPHGFRGRDKVGQRGGAYTAGDLREAQRQPLPRRAEEGVSRKSRQGKVPSKNRTVEVRDDPFLLIRFRNHPDHLPPPFAAESGPVRAPRVSETEVHGNEVPSALLAQSVDEVPLHSSLAHLLVPAQAPTAVGFTMVALPSWKSASTTRRSTRSVSVPAPDQSIEMHLSNIVAS
jgi:hypothetical protein